MISPIKPNTGLWISLNMNYRYYSPETPKRHCICNHTRVLLCRIFSANLPQQYTWKTKHDFPYTIFQPHMNENSSAKVNTIHMKRNYSNHEFHLATETSSLLITNWFHQNILNTKHIKNKTSANGLVTTDYLLLCWLTEILWLCCNH